MDETFEQVVARLRKLAVELVRSHRLSDAAAVLAGVGAVEMMDLFADAKPEVAGAGPVGSSTPGPTGNGTAPAGNGAPAAGVGQHRAPEFDQH